MLLLLQMIIKYNPLYITLNRYILISNHYDAEMHTHWVLQKTLNLPIAMFYKDKRPTLIMSIEYLGLTPLVYTETFSTAVLLE